MAQEEQVLVVERKVIEDLGMFHGLQFDVEPYLEKIFTPGIMSFMPRSKAEVNPDYKQLIPYVVMTYNGKFLNYIRGKRAGEKRLVGNRSMGIGGHVNPIDANGGCKSDSRKMYFSAVEREIEEEVNVQTGYTDQIVALLNDDTNEVGQVHLGVVHYWQLESEDVTRREQMITQMNFMTPQELQDVRESLETWSQLCLDGVADFKQKPEAQAQG
jgi:predicted NUDIX family phosphoesterase